MRLEILEEDWDEAVRRTEWQNDSHLKKQATDPDYVCENCAVAVAAARQFRKPAYVLDKVSLDGVDYTCEDLFSVINMFDMFMKTSHPAYRPTSWPVVLELELVPEWDEEVLS